MATGGPAHTPSRHSHPISSAVSTFARGTGVTCSHRAGLGHLTAGSNHIISHSVEPFTNGEVIPDTRATSAPLSSIADRHTPVSLLSGLSSPLHAGGKAPGLKGLPARQGLSAETTVAAALIVTDHHLAVRLALGDLAAHIFPGRSPRLCRRCHEVGRRDTRQGRGALEPPPLRGRGQFATCLLGHRGCGGGAFGPRKRKLSPEPAVGRFFDKKKEVIGRLFTSSSPGVPCLFPV